MYCFKARYPEYGRNKFTVVECLVPTKTYVKWLGKNLKIMYIRFLQYPLLFNIQENPTIRPTCLEGLRKIMIKKSRWSAAGYRMELGTAREWNVLHLSYARGSKSVPAERFQLCEVRISMGWPWSSVWTWTAGYDHAHLFANPYGDQANLKTLFDVM